MSGHAIHAFLLLIFGHVARGADLVIRIPGGGQPKDGYYRLDYRYVLLVDASSICVYLILPVLHCPHSQKKYFMFSTTNPGVRKGLMSHFV